LTRSELDFLLERREFTKPQKRCIKSRLHKKVKEFADKELPILIEKGLLDGKRFESTSPATSMVALERFGLAAHVIYDITNNIKRSLDMAGIGSPNLPGPLFFLSFTLEPLESSLLTHNIDGLFKCIDKRFQQKEYQECLYLLVKAFNISRLYNVISAYKDKVVNYSLQLLDASRQSGRSPRMIITPVEFINMNKQSVSAQGQ
jgi:hypothetical protein